MRTDLALDQVLDLDLAATTIPGEPASVEPILQAVLDGLRGSSGQRAGASSQR